MTQLQNPAVNLPVKNKFRDCFKPLNGSRNTTIDAYVQAGNVSRSVGQKKRYSFGDFTGRSIAVH
jgi:hypothetical protein